MKKTKYLIAHTQKGVFGLIPKESDSLSLSKGQDTRAHAVAALTFMSTINQCPNVSPRLWSLQHKMEWNGG